jgi:serine/threonine protein kinase
VLAPGDVLRDYTILAPIRSGGMGTLYLASRRGAAGFSRAVAIKVIRPDLAEDPEFVDMFIEEARLCARIHDPHVVHVEELAEERGQLFLVMEYVHGCALAQLIAELGRVGRRLSPEIATFIAMHVAAGLHAAHEVTSQDGEKLGIVHRDVSPHNVLLARQGYVKLIDFGVAAAGRGRGTTGSLRGKIAYMSPEQASGEAVDRRTDIYALGVILWEMLTGRRLFDAPDEGTLLDLVRNAKASGPRDVAPELPETLDAVVRAALDPDPDRRPETAKQLRSRLKDAMPDALKIEAADLAQLVSLVVEDARLTAATLQEAVSEAKAFERTPSRLTGEEEILQTLSLAAPTGRIAPSPLDAPAPNVRRPLGVRQKAGARRRAPLVGVLALMGLGVGAYALVRSSGGAPTPIESVPAPREPPTPPIDAVPVATTVAPSVPAPTRDDIPTPSSRTPAPKAPHVSNESHARALASASAASAPSASASATAVPSSPPSASAPRVLMIDGVPIVAPR